MTGLRTVRLPIIFALAALAAAPTWAGPPSKDLGHGRMPTDAEAAEIARVARGRLPMLPALPPEADEASVDTGASDGDPSINPGAVGSGKASGETLAPSAAEDATEASPPPNYGKNNANSIYQFTDMKVPGNLHKAYPYRAAGYFYFKARDNEWYYCSGSLISNSILVVAGHCVHDGGNGNKGWIKEGMFYPAKKNKSTPYGRAKAVEIYTTDGWFKKGKLDQGYDVGIVVLGKRQGTSREIGSDTGYLGFCYQNCLKHYWFLSQLGYPHNYYDGQEMSIGQHLGRSDSRDMRVGSGMQGGSSGGPHIVNLGALSNSADDKGGYTTRNVVFAVTSWGYTNESQMIQGASTLSGPSNRNDFVGMFNQACARARKLHGSTSCTPL